MTPPQFKRHKFTKIVLTQSLAAGHDLMFLPVCSL